MRNLGPSTLARVLSILAAILVVRVAVGVLFEYRHYIPPNFQSDFLRGREAYFWGGYHWAFYTHLISGPASLILGIVLVSDKFRNWVPIWHRRLGRVQVANVLLIVAPSGLYMAWYAQTGSVAAAGLGTLAIATAVCVALGWRTVVARRFIVHRRWMLRTFVLLCSAIMIRMIGGLATVLDLDAPWLYPASCWFSWLLPLLVFEGWCFLEERAFSLPRVIPKSEP